MLATVLTFSVGLTACGVDEKNEPKQEKNTVVNENSSKENSTSEKESNIKVLDTERVGYAGWFDAKIPEGYVETKANNELTWEFTNQSDQSKTIIIELVKLSDGFNQKAKDISYDHASMEKLAGKEYIGYVYFDIDSNYSVQIRFCGIMYEDEEFSSVMNSFEVFDGDIEKNYKAYLNKN